MREIKFRGKTFNGDWEFGDLSQWNENDGRKRTFISVEGLEPIEVHPDSVGQYTGLKDKNGKEIFEGDIIIINRYKEEAIIEWNDELGFFVLRCYGGEIGKKPLGEWLQEFDLFLIGNIYDNPELIKRNNQ